MATKTISIDVDAYDRLKARKKEGESFSEVIKRLMPKPIEPTVWFKKLEKIGRQMSPEFFAGVEEQIAERRVPRNMGARNDDLSGHKRDARSPGKKRNGKSTRGASRARAA